MNFFDVIAPFYGVFFRRVHERHAEVILKALKPTPGQKFLDAGAGDGHLVRKADQLGVHAVGVDLSPAMLQQARKYYPNLQFIEADVVRLPFPADHFDAIALVDALHHFRQPVAALGELYRVLAPAGTLAILDFDRNFLGTRIMLFGERIFGERPQYFTPKELTEVLEALAFHDVKTSPLQRIEYLAVAKK